MSKSRPDETRIAENLRFLVSHHKSISAACDTLGINRQQFNKYLAGKVVPSLGIQRRICDHFGINPDDLALASDAFRQLFRAERVAAGSSLQRELLRQFDLLRKDGSDLIRDYVGYYHRYYPSFSRPGVVLKSLMHVDFVENVGVFRCIERLPSDLSRGGARHIFKYSGVAFFLRERIFMVGRETLGGHEIMETVLYPSYASGTGLLHGVISGCSASPTRQPVAGRIVLERLGTSPDIRSALRSCGLFNVTSPLLDPSVAEALRESDDRARLTTAWQNLNASNASIR